MPDLTQHSATCQKLLGKAFKEVHAFLDHFFPQYGMNHRQILHHRLGIDLTAAQFGEETRIAAELHIIDDLLPGVEFDQDWQTLRGQIPATWLPYGEPLFVDLTLYDELAQELLNIYGEDLVRTVENGKSRILYEMHETAHGLHKIELVDKRRMFEFEALCEKGLRKDFKKGRQ
ncbi:hypothetical protein MWR57_12730 [Desulfovibrionaceae bacterium CB1MN]|jgi:hypothetical protein|uniref:hypothetical protein n=1 Tax=Hydrosulfovibrio ferrireducens TaxID=2934181 RepID=UPI003ABAB706